MKVASREQMKRIDEILLETYTIEELVDKASDVLFEEIKSYPSVCIVCGKGNNGADGYSLALKLHQNHQDVHVMACSNEHLSHACQYYYDKCVEKGLVVDLNTFQSKIQTCDICVDAIFGFGCNSNPKGIYEEMIQLMNHSNKKIISIDVPSGLNCESGEVYENCVCASQTITFFAYKLGFFYPNAKNVLGKVLIKNLDVLDISNQIVLADMIHSISFRKRSYDGHKGTYGKSFLICGSIPYQGAALMSTKACVNTGCGITCLCSNDHVLNATSLFVPEAIHASNLDTINNYSSILIGCGLLDGEEYLRKVLFETKHPLVIDASSLTDLSKHLDWLENQNRSIILTPHLGEFKRLCPDMKDPTTSAIEFARKYHVTLVLKGNNTLITDGHVAYRNTTGNGAMAIGGSGDVLAGIIVSLLAQGYSSMESACKGVYLHGAIGDEIAKDNYTVLPSKIVDYIPVFMKEFEVNE